MEEKKIELNAAELEKAVGGDDVIAYCSCGGVVTLDCDTRTYQGRMELKCSDCDTWYTTTGYVVRHN